MSFLEIHIQIHDSRWKQYWLVRGVCIKKEIQVPMTIYIELAAGAARKDVIFCSTLAKKELI